RFVGIAYHVQDGRYPFAPSAVRSNRMANKTLDNIPPGPKLDALTAEKVFGWRNIHQHNDRGGLYGKRQDKAGHWRLAKVLNYSTNPAHAYSIDDRMEELGRSDRYEKELSKITHSQKIPLDWATPDQRCRAAIKAVGKYGQVIPLNRGVESRCMP